MTPKCCTESQFFFFLVRIEDWAKSACLSILYFYLRIIKISAGPGGRAVWGVGLRPVACWDCGFESHRMTLRYECCVLSVRDLCDALITRPEESYRLWCVVVCDLETSRMRSPWPALGRSAKGGGGGIKIYSITVSKVCTLSANKSVLPFK